MPAEPARLPVRGPTTAPDVPPAPKHLSEEAAALWRDVLVTFELEPHHRSILERALEALDRLRQAQAAIDRDGITVQGRFGPKAHPATALERDSRIAYLRAIRELGLDLEAPASRPPSRWHE